MERITGEEPPANTFHTHFCPVKGHKWQHTNGSNCPQHRGMMCDECWDGIIRPQAHALASSESPRRARVL